MFEADITAAGQVDKVVGWDGSNSVAAVYEMTGRRRFFDTVIAEMPTTISSILPIQG